MNTLPKEIIREIQSYLYEFDWINSNLVCRSWRVANEQEREERIFHHLVYQKKYEEESMLNSKNFGPWHLDKESLHNVLVITNINKMDPRAYGGNSTIASEISRVWRSKVLCAC